MLLGRPLVVRFVDEKVQYVSFRALFYGTPATCPPGSRPLSLHKVLYSNDRLSDDSAVVEAEKARKQENERDKEHKRIRCPPLLLHQLPFARLQPPLTSSLSWPHSNEAKIKAIQAKLALMKQETTSEAGKQPSSYSTRNPSLRDKPY